MQIVEQFILGKKPDQSFCEDGILITDDFVAVKNNLLRHNVLKLGMRIFGYMLEEQ